MPRDDKGGAVAELERPAEVKQAARPKLVIPLGRGKNGKTVLCRYLAERALNAGRSVVIADADRTNQTLAAFFPSGVISPVNSHDYTMRLFLDALIERQIAERHDVLLDLGAGDLVLKRAAEEMPLVPFLDDQGVMPVAIHMIGPDVDDLAYLQDVENWIDKTGQHEGSFAPRQTVLVLNLGVVPNGMEPKAAFADVRQHAILRAAIERGAKVVVMPALGCMSVVNGRRQSFIGAMSGEATAEGPLGPMNRQRVTTWWSAMESAFAEVAEWLP